jgi:energy-coupling factor transporter transmembrane protein EcfT
MKRIEGTRKQQAVLICGILLVIAVSFPIGTSGNALGALLWLGASFLGLMIGITRLLAFAKPMVALIVLFVASFFIPVEVVVARGEPLAVRWMPCEVVYERAHPVPLEAPDEKKYHVVRGCNMPFGVEPTHVVKISIPKGK